jgi:hypothetical protein
MTEINISNSLYEIQNSFLEMAKNQNYFDINEISTMKTGLFGYITNVAAMIARNSVFQKDLYFNELFLNTANIPKSIYNYAKRYEVEIQQSIPARTTFLFSMKRQDIIDNAFNSGDLIAASAYPILQRLKDSGELTENRNIFILDENNKFSVDVYSFMLARSVIINVEGPNQFGEYSLTAQYALLPGVEEFPLEPVSSPYIKTWVQKDATGVYRFYMVLEAWQMQKKTFSFQNFSENIADTIMFDVDYTDQLAFFRVRYNENGGVIPVGIPSYLDESYEPSNIDRYCYHTFPDENKLRIFFSNKFRPEFNSTVEIDVYTTLGSVANLPQYNGNVLFRFEESSLNKLQVATLSSSDSAGGTDRPTLKELKEKIIKKIIYKNQLITEIDLATYFDIISSSMSVNNSVVKFLKKRDDVLRREFLAFLLLKDSYGQIIPTNTCTLSLIDDDIVNDKLVILPNSLIKYNKTSKEFSLKLQADSLTDSNLIYYMMPFLLVADLSVSPLLAYYYLTTVDTSELIDFSKPDTSLTKEILISKIDAKRDVTIADGKLKLSFNINTNIDNFELPVIPPDASGDEPLLTDFTFGVTEPDNQPVDTSGTEPPLGDPTYDAWLALHNQYLAELEIWNDAYDSWNEKYNAYTLAHNSWLAVHNSYLQAKNDYDRTCTDIINSRVLIRGTLSKDNVVYGYFDTKIIGPDDDYFDENNPDHETMTFSAFFELDDEHAADGQISLISCTTSDEEGNTIIADLPIYENMDIELKVRYSIDNTVDVHDNVDPNVYLGFTSTNPVYFFRILEDVMTSEIIVDPDTSEKTVTLVPLVGRRYLIDEEGNISTRLTKLMNTLWSYGDMLTSSFNKLENNTRFDLKFFNTHGIGTNFKKIETDGTPAVVSVVNTDISISLNIKLLRSQLFSAALDKRIKDSIISYVEDINKNNGILSFSNLSNYLETNFSEIQYIQLVGIDGDTKTLINTETNSYNLTINEHTINIPEFLSIGITNPDTLEKNITITYIS